MENTSYSIDNGAKPAEVPKALMGNLEGHSALAGHWLCPSLQMKDKCQREGIQLYAMILSQLLQRYLD